MANTAGPATFPGGMPSATPHYLVDINGNPLGGGGNPLPVSQIVGSGPITAANPEINISNMQQFILNGQHFVVSSGKQSAGINAAAQFLVTNAGAKNVVIDSIQIGYTNAANIHQVQLISASDANITGGTGAASPTAKNLGFAATTPQAQTSFTYCTAIANSGVATGSPLAEPAVPINQTIEVLMNGIFVYIPPATAGGIGIYMQTTATGQFSMTIKWVEF